VDTHYFDDLVRLAAFTLKHSMEGMHVRRHLTSDSEGGRFTFALTFEAPFVVGVRLSGPTRIIFCSKILTVKEHKVTTRQRKRLRGGCICRCRRSSHPLDSGESLSLAVSTPNTAQAASLFVV
jgi:hypothetical protein